VSSPAAPDPGLLERARDALRRRRPLAAAQLLDAASPALRGAPAWALLRGLAHARLGDLEAATPLLEALTRGPEPWAAEATAALADAFHLLHQAQALRELLAAQPGWARTPRGALFQARLLAPTDPEQALRLWLSLAGDTPAPGVPRLAGFDAVRLLDRLGRHAEAHALAQRLHAAQPPGDVAGLLAELSLQQRLLAKGAAWCPPRAAPVHDLAFIVGLPRSGTTLLAQMLDAHPALAGIGEHEGLGVLADALASAGVWPYRLKHLAQEAAAQMQQQYRRGARLRARPEARFTLDKSLLSWRVLPGIAAVLPGAVALHLQRDPRDMAVSLFLSDLDPVGFAWAARLDTIRQVIEAEHALVPLALRTLSIAHESVAYESLVADPRATLQRCLQRLGLPMDERVLAPERNPRAALTLSHEQVRRPLNDASVGRWQHYAFAFDAHWHALAQAHRA
jgi:hypothetical protein